MGRALTRLRSAIGRKKVLEGGKRAFTADGTGKSFRIKRVSTPRGRMRASGAHSEAYDFVVYKGPHKTRLVVRKYRRWLMPKELTQTKLALREFSTFQTLRAAKEGYPLPPTVRLVKIGKEKYVALTDLSKFGDMQTKVYDDIEKILNRDARNRIVTFINRKSREAWEKHGIILDDSWEFVIDTKRRTVRPFILDLGIEIGLPGY